MAGTCYGDGLTRDPEGNLTLNGPREGDWLPQCALADHTGLRIDPTDGRLWVPPDSRHLSAQGITDGQPERLMIPGALGTYQVAEIDLEMQAPPCERAVALYDINGGYTNFSVGNSNAWGLNRVATVSVDGVPVGTSGLQRIAGVTNNTGGQIAVAAMLAERSERRQLGPGQKFKLQLVYTLEVTGYAANGLNSFTWRAPVIEGTMLGYPLA